MFDIPELLFAEFTDMFNVIDDEAKAYTLGIMASSQLIGTALVVRDVAYFLMHAFGKHIVKEGTCYKIGNETNIYQDIKKYLFDSNGNKLYPMLHIRALQWAFIRGVFDSKMGSLAWNESEPMCTISAPGDYLYNIAGFSNIPSVIDYENNTITFNGTNCIDFLGEMYPHNTIYKFEQKYKKYLEFLLWKPTSIEFPHCKVFKVDDFAVIPSKCKESDAGYDLTIIKEAKKLLPSVTLYDSGIQIQVSHGLYVEIVPRSSLSKSGYMLANNVGIIDRGYTGNILVALIKVDQSAPDLTLPFKCCQLIFRHQVHVNMKEVKVNFKETSRGAGGFGSTSYNQKSKDIII